MRRLLERRVPQIVGLYVAGGWGFVQFVDWAVEQYQLSPDLVNFVVTLLLVLLPSVIWLAWRHGAPGRDGWGARDGGIIFVNLVVAAGVLVLTFAGRELGAATTVKLVEDDQGNVVERAVPKAAFRKAVLGFRFENASSDPDLDWLRQGFDLAISFDIGQDPFVRYTLENHPFVRDLLGEAGFGPEANVPIALRRRAAETLDIEHFLEGVFRADGDTLEVTTRLYETRNARPAAEHTYRGTDPLEIVDRVSVDLRTDLGIPEWQIAESVDLPAAELLTEDREAFRALAEADGAMASGDVTGARASAEQAVALDSTSAMAHVLAGWMSFASGDLAAGRPHMDAMARFDWRLPERTRLAIRAQDQLFFRQDPEAALRTAGYWAEVYPEDPEAWKTLAMVRLQGLNQEEAIPHLQALLEIDPTDPDGTRWLGGHRAARQRARRATAARRADSERHGEPPRHRRHPHLSGESGGRPGGAGGRPDGGAAGLRRPRGDRTSGPARGPRRRGGADRRRGACDRPNGRRPVRAGRLRGVDRLRPRTGGSSGGGVQGEAPVVERRGRARRPPVADREFGADVRGRRLGARGVGAPAAGQHRRPRGPAVELPGRLGLDPDPPRPRRRAGRPGSRP
ncbi:MAG: hypothetical protein AMS19_15120 [Gemmatimonas sp. SG8_23]|nr:MAG: hypothetical protein AMS19_15120 [Gemmatimonas sp. SG8_23]